MADEPTTPFQRPATSADVRAPIATRATAGAAWL